MNTSASEFDGPLSITDATETAVGRRVTDTFAAWVDGACETSTADTGQEADQCEAELLRTERGRIAFARLAREQPLLASAVHACVVEGLSVRAAAPRFGVSHKAVHMRKHKGLETMRLGSE